MQAQARVRRDEGRAMRQASSMLTPAATAVACPEGNEGVDTETSHSSGGGVGGPPDSSRGTPRERPGPAPRERAADIARRSDTAGRVPMPPFQPTVPRPPGGRTTQGLQRPGSVPVAAGQRLVRHGRVPGCGDVVADRDGQGEEDSSRRPPDDGPHIGGNHRPGTTGPWRRWTCGVGVVATGFPTVARGRTRLRGLDR
jgi:hypothetical protein